MVKTSITYCLSKVFLLLTLAVMPFFSFSQSMCLGTDTTLCPGSSIAIDDCNFGIDGVFLDNPTGVFMGDDEYSPVVPIGFGFNFYGVSYSNCTIGANGLISFDLSKANGYCSWDLTMTNPLPTNSNTDALLSIMPAYHDLDPSAGASPQGQIVFQTIGTAPNRRFVVLYKSLMAYDSGVCTYMALILNEGANSFETHIGTKPVYVGWNNGLAVQGSQNANGNVAHITPGRNVTQWAVNLDSKKWTPTSPTNTSAYGISTIPYVHVFNVNNGILQWQNTLGQSFPFNGNLTVNAVPNSSVGYFLTANIVYCSNITTITSDTSWVTSLDVTMSSDSVSCPGGSDGNAFAQIIPTTANTNYLWNDPLAQTTQTAVGLQAGIYNCLITGAHECNISVEVFEIEGMIGAVVDHVDVACGGDGSLEVAVSQGTAPYSFSWDNSTSTTTIADNLSSGPYACTITDDNGCTIVIRDTIYDPFPFELLSITPNTTICPNEQITLNVQGFGGSLPYTYEWTNNGNIVGIEQNLTVDPLTDFEEYCVNITEFCGATVGACTIISSYEGLEPNAVSDKYDACSPGSFTFTNTSTNPNLIASTHWEFISPFATYSFTSNGTNPISESFITPGIYDLILSVTSTDGCVFVSTIQNIIHVYPSPIANFHYSPNPITMFETTVYLQNMSTSDVIYWDWFSPGSSPSTSHEVSPIIAFPEEVVSNYPVTLAVENEFGCVDTITKILEVENEILFYAPNTFTPDGDEFNQTWKPEILGLDIYNFDLFIFNRWGEIIWENHDPSMGWDGTYKGRVVSDGTYTWRAKVSNSYDGEREEFIGSINLIR